MRLERGLSYLQFVGDLLVLSAVRYVGLNPVRVDLVKQAQDWPWSSARAHPAGEADGVTDLEPMQDRLPSGQRDRFRRLRKRSSRVPIAERSRSTGSC